MRQTRCFRTRRSASSTTSTALPALTPLCGTERRRPGAGGFGGFGGDGVDLGDIFGDIFGGGFGGFGGSSRQANPNAPRKGQDIRVRITLSFDEAVHGCKKNITITRQQECTECHGTGCAAGTSPRPARTAAAAALSSAAAHPLWRDADPAALLPLRRQGQAGQEPLQELPRQRQVATKKTLEVSIPRASTTIRASHSAAWAMPVPTAAPPVMSSCMVTVRPARCSSATATMSGSRCPSPTARLSWAITSPCPSIDGKVEYTVPEGTQSGTTFRLRGKGIQYLNGRAAATCTSSARSRSPRS